MNVLYAAMAIAALILSGISFGSAVSCLITFIALMKKRNQGSGREKNIKSLANADFGNIAAPFNFSYSLNHQQDFEKLD